jgi:hypothetical protein
MNPVSELSTVRLEIALASSYVLASRVASCMFHLRILIQYHDAPGCTPVCTPTAWDTTARTAVWYSSKDLAAVLHSFARAGAGYVTRRRSQGLKSPGGAADRSRAEKLWLVCGVMGDVMLCDRERDIHPVKNFILLSIPKKWLTSQ